MSQDGGWEDVSHELQTGEGWEDVSHELPKPSRKAEAGLQGFGNGAAFGYLPHLQAMAEPAMGALLEQIASTDAGAKLMGVPKSSPFEQDDYTTRRDQNIKIQNNLAQQEPGAFLAGSVGGGLASGIATAGMMPAAAAPTALARIGQAAKTGAIIGGVSNPGDQEGEVSPLQLWDRTKNAGIGAGAGAATQGSFEGISKMLNPLKRASALVAPSLKNNSGQIIQDAESLGIKPTPGMLSERGGFTERMEDSLQNSPSIFGANVRQSRSNIQNKLAQAAQEMGKDASSQTPLQIGDNFKRGIGENLDARSMPISGMFDDIANSTKNIPVGEKSLQAVGRNIENNDLFRMLPGGKPQQYREMLGKVQNANDVKTIVTLLGKDIESSQGAERAILSEMKDKLSNLEKNSITRAAIQSSKEGASKNEFLQLAAGDEGEKTAAELIRDLKQARSGWRDLHQDMNAVGKGAGINSKGGPSAFKNKLDAIPSQSIQDKFLNPERIESVTALKNKFPEQFDLLRQGKIRDVMDASLYKGDVSAQRFVKEAGKLDPEIQSMLFGADASKIKQMKTLVESLPKDFNPSGTSSASMFSWNGIQSNISDIPRYIGYKASGSDGVRSSLSNGLGNVSAGADALVKAPQMAGAVPASIMKPVKPFDQAIPNDPTADPRLLEILGKNPEMLEKIRNPKLREALRLKIQNGGEKPKDPRQSFLEGN